ncbi:hypothetical protein STA3757_01530 [Stanieria sp. NIES-3757]|nr:hypothetical protein STA3757_01530 [Stanieria sp. NIES-3757]
MSNDSDRFIKLEIYAKASQTELLIGLDTWLRLGLIKESQVKSLCRNYLTCPLPDIEIVKVTSQVGETGSQPIQTPIIESVPRVKAPLKPNFIEQIWQAFLDELSIRWLLFLGIFLVVVSSGVLAATQWHNFSTVGQYLILLIYTLSFWLVGFWLSKQDNLNLTSQSLKSIAILLVPINFWGINSFGLGNKFGDWLVIAIAFFSLTGITFWEYNPKPKYIRFGFVPIFLLLSYLHLVWHLLNFRILAIYLGIITIASTTYYLSKQYNYQFKNLLLLLTTWLLLIFRFLLIQTSITSLGLAISICGWLLAILYLDRSREFFSEQENNTRARSDNQIIIDQSLEKVGLILLLLGGIVAGVIWFNSVKWYPWQAIAVCALTLYLFKTRLQIFWRKLDLLAIFFIGLKTLFLLKELMPISLRENVLNFSETITNVKFFPESVYSITLFPYLILFVAITSWLYRQEKPQLALFCEWLNLCFGVFLTLLSWYNPTWRSLNFFLSTVTLGYVATIRQPFRIRLIYFTHLLGLITAISLIDWWFSPPSREVWGIILLLLMLGEWLIFIRRIAVKNSRYQKIWYRSSWYFGLLLAGISYVCFLPKYNPVTTSIIAIYSLTWLLTSTVLTIVAKFNRGKQRQLAALLSCFALVLVQVLTFNHLETRAISLTVATILMFINSFYCCQTIAAVLHFGFGLSLISSLLWQYLSFSNWLIVSAIVIISLYKIRQDLLKDLATDLKTKFSQLRKKYAQATDYWAISLISLELAILTLFYLNFAFSDLNYQQIGINWQYFLSSTLISGAIWFRYRQQPTPKILYAFAWTIELSVFSLIILIGGNQIAIAVTNIILASLSLWLINRFSSQSFHIVRANNHLHLETIVYDTSNLNWHNLHHLPIIYLVLGILWRLPYFTATTGLITLGAALTGIGIGSYPDRENKIISYLSLAGITLAIYELAIYQMMQTSGGSLADGLTILALVAAVIAIFYRILAFWWRQQFLLNFSLNQIIVTAHLHWAIASILKIIAAGITIETVTPRLTLLSIGISFCLGAYAILQGRDLAPTSKIIDTNQSPSLPFSQFPSQSSITTIKENNISGWWVYVGLVEIAATLVYSRLIITKLSIFDPWRVILTCIIALAIYQIPWQNFGWRSTPWRRTALVIPALMALVTAESISYLSLLATAAFYLRIAYHQRNLRWSYLSLGLIDWGIIRYSWQNNGEPIWFALVIGLSCLYIAQFDLKLQTRQQLRHYFRLFGSGLICIVALILYQKTGIIPSAIALVFILAGLGLRIRAFLYIGTITFILTIIYQLIILIFTYSFLKWIVGLIAGIVAIAIAANFERKSTQITNKLQDYLAQLQQWQ